MDLVMDRKEQKILQTIEEILRNESVSMRINSIIPRVEQKLSFDVEALLAWEPIPLNIYGERLPDIIKSSWVFILRSYSNTGAEKHPNSHQRMMSYRGSGDLQIQVKDEWRSNELVSNYHLPINRRWVSIPPNTWHRALVSSENWAVVSFHTVPPGELIEERLDSTTQESIVKRRYLDGDA